MWVYEKIQCVAIIIQTAWVGGRGGEIPFACMCVFRGGVFLSKHSIKLNVVNGEPLLMR